MFTPSSQFGYADFARRADAGEALTVVFFGGSITWGAGASDPNTTSFRPLVASRLAAAYPKARFRFVDAAIGGTGSRIGAFRMERDVLRYQPDLVFLDFTLNDDPRSCDLDSLASYETVLRRLLGSGSLVMQVLVPNMEIACSTDVVARRPAHVRLAEYYGNPVADVIGGTRSRVIKGQANPDVLWPSATDKTHPGDPGYAIYAEQIWEAFTAAVDAGAAPMLRSDRLHAGTYDVVSRTALATLPALPKGWTITTPSTTSPCGDFVMSRWLDSIVEAASGAAELQFSFHGSVVQLFGESTLDCGSYDAQIDNGASVEFDAHAMAAALSGSGHHFPLIAADLDPAKPHVLTIRPRLSAGQVLRFESVCVAAG